MKSVAQPEILDQLVTRLNALRRETERRWGTMTSAEMLCHLGDCTQSVLTSASRRPGRPRPITKWFALYAPVRWPRGKIKTRREVDPRAGGTRPSDFEADRHRAIDGLRALASATAFPPSHFMFGAMTAQDWWVWGFKHTDHHLRQFGV
jgi:uncharacterized protein DUF1569